ncbi:c-type cytochrome biogenesis protein CcmI [Commensalibacter papalotli (ex Botero et al. 2024)]|uniref:Cytochrome c-type biogenesis protein CcmH/NrfG (NrfG) n=1 Tax=Commensalibacter papalotli (ex Botero et al. 2024) TaxID=2972766 RepID=A0ABN8WB71_9PROT|nr:c-type cytochrome biogenesis protein CcmI [Commensalibacter papalotli (ex Botero et al. 2024)]CAI3933911.1 Cytochrome c-type biogenesis protein CcmH/NrfG (NrfG) [Commensalibacter papalotli (ex Botero et al. 2024)]CAI3941775.1 Cytochrome c-type biogenesis protein CcmH/NrfG (NrfG) [Commensalibacter papalotli (ex Botero et al. 2024)]
MLWIVIILFSLLCLLPCWITLYKAPTVTNAQQSALRVYQSQLKELKNDLEHGLILKTEYDQAQLEIQRRLLKSDPSSATTAPLQSVLSTSGFVAIALGLLCIPMAAMGLYIMNGVPALPAAPLAPRMAEQEEMNQKIVPYIEQLKAKLTTLSVMNPKRVEGYLLLGKIEASRGNLPAAVVAWKEALNQQYDPNLAAQIAELQTQIEGKVSTDSVNLFRKALEAAPQDAPWRALAEQRITQYEKTHP